MDAIVKASRRRPISAPSRTAARCIRDPFDPDAPPQSAAIPMILGNTHDETRTLIGRGDPSIFDLTWETLKAKLEANSPFMGDARSRQGDRGLPALVSAVLAGRRVLRLDDGVALVARAGDRGRTARRAAGRGGSHLGVSVRLAHADRRRPLGRTSRARRAVRLRQRAARAGQGRHWRRRAGGRRR